MWYELHMPNLVTNIKGAHILPNVIKAHILRNDITAHISKVNNGEAIHTTPFNIKAHIPKANDDEASNAAPDGEAIHGEAIYATPNGTPNSKAIICTSIQPDKQANNG
jgi:hypothetical protein